MIRKVFVMCAVVAVAALSAAAPALAAGYSPDGPTVATPSSSVTNGGSTTVSGQGWMPGSTVTLAIHSTTQSLGTATAGSDGSFTADVALPCLDAGSHTITATGTGADGSSKTASTSVTLSGGCDPATGTLPHTGSDSTPMLTLVAGLLLVGAVLLIAARRRSAMVQD